MSGEGYSNSAGDAPTLECVTCSPTPMKTAMDYADEDAMDAASILMRVRYCTDGVVRAA